MINHDFNAEVAPFFDLAEGRRLAVCGLAELPAYLDGRVSHIISLIDPRLEFNRIACDGHLILRMHDIDEDLPGHSAPTAADAGAILSFVAGMAEQEAGFSLVVHCHAGVSRSSATALAAMLALDERLDPETALADLALHRPQIWPNALLTGHFDRALGLDGSLIDAVARYRRDAFTREFGGWD
ncbi:MAG: protein-tyrosine-phosphatase [Alphaproteobacteria bacterium]